MYLNLFDIVFLIAKKASHALHVEHETVPSRQFSSAQIGTCRCAYLTILGGTASTRTVGGKVLFHGFFEQQFQRFQHNVIIVDNTLTLCILDEQMSFRPPASAGGALPRRHVVRHAAGSAWSERWNPATTCSPRTGTRRCAIVARDRLSVHGLQSVCRRLVSARRSHSVGPSCPRREHFHVTLEAPGPARLISSTHRLGGDRLGRAHAAAVARRQARARLAMDAEQEAFRSIENSPLLPVQVHDASSRACPADAARFIPSRQPACGAHQRSNHRYLQLHRISGPLISLERVDADAPAHHRRHPYPDYHQRFLFDFLRAQQCFRSRVVENEGAFPANEPAPLFTPTGDGWWLDCPAGRRSTLSAPAPDR